MKMLVYSEFVSPRLDYLVNTLWKELTGMNTVLTTNSEVNTDEYSFKINYSNRQLDGWIQIIPQKILFEASISKQSLYFHTKEQILSFEKDLQNKQYIYSHDLFATIFYLVTRYEEYLPFTPDSHGRFSAPSSVLFQNNIHRFPYVDKLIQDFSIYIKDHIEEIDLPDKKVQNILTVDIDQIYKYQGKKRYILLLKMIKSVIAIDLEELKSIANHLWGNKKDPYDCYHYIDSFAKVHQLETHLFLLLADYGKYDRNHLDLELLKNIISTLKNIRDIGIHPSYLSNTQISLLEKEINIYKQILGRIPNNSRQHFLKLRFPETYTLLLSQGITHDYTMGWADEIGFRAGTSKMYTWFDLSRNASTLLYIHPFCAMDVTLKNYLKLSPENAIIQLEELKKYIEEFGGNFVTLWHNESLGNTGEWEGWRNVCEKAYT